MKPFLVRLSDRIDALTLRERITLFAGVLVSVVFLAYSMVLGPLSAQQDALAARIAQNNAGIVEAEGQVAAMVKGAQVDPDAATRARLAVLTAEIAQLGLDLRNMQQSLVSPQQIVPLLEQMVRANGALRLVSLRTLPVAGLSEALPSGALEAAAKDAAAPTSKGGAEAASSAAPAAAQPVAKAPDMVYRHGVELSLEGGYLDMVNYMSALEAMPVRMIWGQAQLDARSYPQARLTLTLYTLSLDREWMKL